MAAAASTAVAAAPSSELPSLVNICTFTMKVSPWRYERADERLKLEPVFGADNRSLRVVAAGDNWHGLVSGDIISSSKLTLAELWQALVAPKGRDSLELQIQRHVPMDVCRMPDGGWLRVPSTGDRNLAETVQRCFWAGLSSSFCHLEKMPCGRHQATIIPLWPAAGDEFILNGKICVVPETVTTTYVSIDKNHTWRDVGANATAEDVFASSSLLKDVCSGCVTDQKNGIVLQLPQDLGAKLPLGFLRAHMQYKSMN